MGYRGRGGYRGDLTSSVYSLGDDYSVDTGSDDTAAPDFSDVTGGSSSAYNFDDVLTGGLGSLSGIFGSGGGGLGVGTAIQKFLGGVGSAGPGVGAAIAGGATAGVGAVKRALAKHAKARIGRALGVGGSSRRMNPLNVRAARRALRRLHGFDRIAKSILHITSPKKKVHGFRFKRRKRH